MAFRKTLPKPLSGIRKAAEQGESYGWYNLGVAYRDGNGVPQDDVEAVKWFRMAAKKGVASAWCNLAFAYHYGKGVQQNNTEAVRCYRMAAEQGYSHAQYNRGVLYETSDESRATSSCRNSWRNSPSSTRHLRLRPGRRKLQPAESRSIQRKSGYSHMGRPSCNAPTDRLASPSVGTRPEFSPGVSELKGSSHHSGATARDF